MGLPHSFPCSRAADLIQNTLLMWAQTADIGRERPSNSSQKHNTLWSSRRTSSRLTLQDLIDAGHKIRWVNAGVSDSPSKLQFTLSSRDDSSTFTISKDQAQAAGLRQILVDVKTLNEISCDSGAPPPEMVKIDAEGLDLRALKGASDLFGHTDIFLVEAAIFDSTAENTLENVTGFMNESGYRLLDITDLNRSPKYGVLWLCELAFLKRSSPLLESVSSYE
jgi:FkbM family methyltransferase